MNTNAKDILEAYKTRLKVIQTIVEDTRGLLEEFRQRREKISQELKTALSKFQSLRKKDFDKMMEEIVGIQTKQEEEVKQVLANFQAKETKILENFKKMLGKGERLRLKDLKKTLAKIKEEQEIGQKETPEKVNTEITQMRSQIQEMLKNFKKEREEISKEWKNMLISTLEKEKQ